MRKIGGIGKTLVAGAASIVVAATLVACGGTANKGGGSTGSAADGGGTYKISMVTDVGGVNDQSFNQLSWEGLQKLEKDGGVKVGYTESKQESDYPTNLDRAVDGKNNLVWGVGYAMADAVKTAAKQNPDVNFAIIDDAGDTSISNLTGLMFRSQESSFVAGFIAASQSKTGKVGFVGGQVSDIVDMFEWGYKAGVDYANKENGTNVTVSSQYTESFTDEAKGKAIAAKMYSDGCDVIFHAAGGAGKGVIDAAKDANKLIIGVDSDQYRYAPKNMLTSALKNVDTAVVDISKRIRKGEKLGGKTITLGMEDGAVGLAPEHDLMDDKVYDAAQKLMDKIKKGDVKPPANEKQYDTWHAELEK
ncbi:nucleoside-binding protein [Coriobacterium glomerans PW2]|uniref:Nucleoside-binding protein n=1 Tax=Coriobacterium glomerans (strain ATCC 49209 / DSM 20642 / JCM 10262 / PW2) TaxID=700015 RepID=F2NBA1_CORGP|nr:BMP family ABC transporter substrate-binding protein [Coriobacterium glomerans]AEB06637.1 nucleoside-binding protein [Coriobacterium glomerans PW2]